MRKISRQLFFTVSAVFFANQALAVNPQVAKLVEWETRGNAVAVRNPAPFKIEHFEIPLDLLKQDFAASLDPAVRQALIFERDGREWVRWLINPEDTKWYKGVEEWMRSKGLSTKKHQYLTAYMTASRSFIIEDPATKTAFSAKVSTNVTGGNWRDKNLPIYDAEDIRMTSDMVDEVRAKVAFQHLDFLNEPLMLAIGDIDQALLVRSLDEAAAGKKYYMPLFSALHEDVGREIARINGSSSPAAFWQENLAKPLGRAYAEFAAHFGMTYDSGHGQNFVIELDSKMKPTGRIIFRDFADSYVLKPFMANAGRADFLREFEADNIIADRLQVSVGFLHGNQPPSWIDHKVYGQFNQAFFVAFEEEFSKLTGIPVQELNQVTIGGYSSGMSYFTKFYSVKSPAWQAYLKNAGCYQGQFENCPPDVLARFRAKAGVGASAVARGTPVKVSPAPSPVAPGARPNCFGTLRKVLNRPIFGH